MCGRVIALDIISSFSAKGQANPPRLPKHDTLKAGAYDKRRSALVIVIVIVILPMREQYVIGKHLVVTDEDVVTVRWAGPVNLDQMRAIQRIYEERLLLHPRLYSVFQVTRAHTPPPEVRRQMAAWRQTHKVAGSAVVGASRVIRSIAMLYLRATMLLGLKTWPVCFVESEAEAHEFFAELRRAADGAR